MSTVDLSLQLYIHYTFLITDWHPWLNEILVKGVGNRVIEGGVDSLIVRREIYNGEESCSFPRRGVLD